MLFRSPMGAAGKNGKVRLVTCTKTKTKTGKTKTSCRTQLVKGTASFDTSKVPSSGVVASKTGNRLRVKVIEQENGGLQVRRPNGRSIPPGDYVLITATSTRHITIN